MTPELREEPVLLTESPVKIQKKLKEFDAQVLYSLKKESLDKVYKTLLENLPTNKE